MLYRFLFLCLVVFAPCAHTPTLFADSVEQPWLNCSPTNRFSPLLELSLQTTPGYEEQFVPYLMARGVNDDLAMATFFQEDLFHIAHALSILFEQDSSVVLHNLLGEHVSLIEGHSAHIDHVGRELFGPISFYLPIIEQMAPQVGLKKIRDFIFPSTQVVKVLQEHDSHVKGVTIGRVYFQSNDAGSIRCLELFQASLPNGTFPQSIVATQARISLLTSSQGNSTITPIDHLSIELQSVADVQNIHTCLQQLSSKTLIPYQKEISHNPGDGSTQTKAVMRDSTDTPFNKIVEFVHYTKRT